VVHVNVNVQDPLVLPANKAAKHEKNSEQE
jgi:hypothetical protein